LPTSNPTGPDGGVQPSDKKTPLAPVAVRTRGDVGEHRQFCCVDSLGLREQVNRPTNGSRVIGSAWTITASTASGPAPDLGWPVTASECVLNLRKIFESSQPRGSDRLRAVPGCHMAVDVRTLLLVVDDLQLSG
jgi:hypothetical protein